MNYQADFKESEIKFEPVPPYIPKGTQAAMFMDRPDLWRKPKKQKTNKHDKLL